MWRTEIPFTSIAKEGECWTMREYQNLNHDFQNQCCCCLQAPYLTLLFPVSCSCYYKCVACSFSFNASSSRTSIQNTVPRIRLIFARDTLIFSRPSSATELSNNNAATRKWQKKCKDLEKAWHSVIEYMYNMLHTYWLRANIQ